MREAWDEWKETSTSGRAKGDRRSRAHSRVQSSLSRVLTGFGFGLSLVLVTGFEENN